MKTRKHMTPLELLDRISRDLEELDRVSFLFGRASQLDLRKALDLVHSVEQLLDSESHLNKEISL